MWRNNESGGQRIPEGLSQLGCHHLESRLDPVADSGAYSLDTSPLVLQQEQSTPDPTKDERGCCDWFQGAVGYRCRLAGLQFTLADLGQQGGLAPSVLL